MHQPFTSHTLSIFEHLKAETPPLVPDEIIADMDAALSQMKSNYDLTTEELENTLIVFGKRIWPYRKAFEEFLDVSEAELGEKFLLGRMSRGSKQRYQEFKAHGGTLRDLHTGNPAAFFSSDERLELCSELVGMNDDVRRNAAQRVLSTDKEKYQNRVIEFQTILEDIEKRLDTLRIMADDEQEHPELAAEIRAQIRSFEYGLCLLGPAHHYEAVCRAEEHFRGRKKEKTMFGHVA